MNTPEALRICMKARGTGGLTRYNARDVTVYCGDTPVSGVISINIDMTPGEPAYITLQVFAAVEVMPDVAQQHDTETDP